MHDNANRCKMHSYSQCLRAGTAANTRLFHTAAYTRLAYNNRSAASHCGTSMHMMVQSVWHETEHSLLLALAELPQPEQPSEPHAAHSEPPTSHSTAGAEPGIFQPLPNPHHQTSELTMVRILHHCHQPCMQCAAFIHYWKLRALL